MANFTDASRFSVLSSFGIDTPGRRPNGSYFIDSILKVYAPGATYMNRVYDTSINQYVFWRTTGSPDIASGAQYPGPGTFGVDTEAHVIHAIIGG